MSYTADSIRIRIVTPDSIRIRFERKRPIRRSLITRCSSSASIEDSCAYADLCATLRTCFWSRGLANESASDTMCEYTSCALSRCFTSPHPTSDAVEHCWVRPESTARPRCAYCRVEPTTSARLRRTRTAQCRRCSPATTRRQTTSCDVRSADAAPQYSQVAV